jgi:hypothetical protein
MVNSEGGVVFPTWLAGDVPENFGTREVTCVFMIFPNFKNSL